VKATNTSRLREKPMQYVLKSPLGAIHQRRAIKRGGGRPRWKTSDGGWGVGHQPDVHKQNKIGRFCLFRSPIPPPLRSGRPCHNIFCVVDVFMCDTIRMSLDGGGAVSPKRTTSDRGVQQVRFARTSLMNDTFEF